MTASILARMAEAVAENLSGAEIVGLLPARSREIEREGYYERAAVVTWRRKVRGNQPSPDGDGYVYGTHLVHANSRDETACFHGHYDMGLRAALADMAERSGLSLAVTR